MKNKEPKTLSQLNDIERRVYELCQESEICTNSNTILCIKFWQKYSQDELIKPTIVEDYPPESITRARRHLVEWGHLIPNETIQKKRRELEASYHAPDYMKHTQIVWRDGVPYQVAC